MVGIGIGIAVETTERGGHPRQQKGSHENWQHDDAWSGVRPHPQQRHGASRRMQAAQPLPWAIVSPTANPITHGPVPKVSHEDVARLGQGAPPMAEQQHG